MSLNVRAGLMLALCLASFAGRAQAQVVDRRPPDDGKAKRYARFMGSCDFGVFALAEQGGAADRLGKLRTTLEADLGARLSGHEIVLNRYRLYINMADQIAGQASAVAAASVGVPGAYDVSARGARCPKEKMTAGWYSGSEITSPYPPFITEIEITIDGRARAVRSVYSPPAKVLPLDSKYVKPRVAEALNAALAKANKAASDAVASELPAGQGAGAAGSPSLPL